jgi:hypothetical protein
MGAGSDNTPAQDSAEKVCRQKTSTREGLKFSYGETLFNSAQDRPPWRTQEPVRMLIRQPVWLRVRAFVWLLGWRSSGAYHRQR